MIALEKAKLALRKHLLENKNKVAADLIIMREKSARKDIFTYVENLSSAYSLNHLTTSKEILSSHSFIETDFKLINELIEYSFYTPPDNKVYNYIKKDAEISSGSFFLLTLYYVRNKKSRIFI